MNERPPADVWMPDTVSHPGETLRDLLRERGLTQAWLARQLRVARSVISHLVNDRRRKKIGIGPSTAIKLEAIGLGNARFWLHRQADYDLWRERRRQKGLADRKRSRA